MGMRRGIPPKEPSMAGFPFLVPTIPFNLLIFFLALLTIREERLKEFVGRPKNLKFDPGFTRFGMTFTFRDYPDRKRSIHAVR